MLLVVAMLVLGWVAIVRYGADSRDGRDWLPPAGGGSARPRLIPQRRNSPRRDFLAVLALLRRSGAGLVAFHRAQADLWERYLSLPAEDAPLRWVRTGRGWRLAGRTVPPVRDAGNRPSQG